MKWYQFFFIMGAIYLTPHVDKWAGLSIGAGMYILAFIALRDGE